MFNCRRFQKLTKKSKFKFFPNFFLNGNFSYKFLTNDLMNFSIFRPNSKHPPSQNAPKIPPSKAGSNLLCIHRCMFKLCFVGDAIKMQLRKISAKFESELMNWLHKQQANNTFVHTLKCRIKWRQIITTVSFFLSFLTAHHIILYSFMFVEERVAYERKKSCWWWWLLGVSFWRTSVLSNNLKKCVIKSELFLSARSPVHAH